MSAPAGTGWEFWIDHGGTFTDVTLFDGQFERHIDWRVAGVRLQMPLMTVHTVAAGGGSRLRLRDGRLPAGPDSAGAVLPGAVRCVVEQNAGRRCQPPEDGRAGGARGAGGRRRARATCR